MLDFERLFQDNRNFIFKYLVKLTQNPSLAEELTQETFFRAYMNYTGLRNPDKAPVWLCQIAKNAYFAWYHEHRRLVPLEEALHTEETPTPQEEFIQRELSQKAFSCLQELEPPYKDVFMLAVFGNLSLKEISESYGKSESWARVTFYRAKQKLLNRMEEDI